MVAFLKVSLLHTPHAWTLTCRSTLGIASASSMLILHESPREVVWHEDSRYNERIFGGVAQEWRLR